MSKRKTTEEFLIEAINVYNNYYNYSLTKYVNAKKKIKIICPVHGIFKQLPNNHLNHGCKKCSKLLDVEYLIIKFNKIHNNKYKYKKVKYKGMHSKIKIMCSVHGTFEQLPSNHIVGKGCPKCVSNYKKSLTDIIKKANDVHNDKYDYSKLKKANVNEKVKIICPKHDEFVQILNNHLRGHGCPFCNESKGEREIEKILIKNNIKYYRQFKFKNCKDKRELSFDFYLPDFNICIEYDGIQHFKKFEHFGGEKTYKITKKHDNIKNKYCKENNINLIRVSYKQNIVKELENIKKINNE